MSGGNMNPIYKSIRAKKPMFIIFTLVLVMLLALGIYAVTQTVNTFSDSTVNKNITWTVAGTNQTAYIYIPLYVYSNNLTVMIEGLSS